MATKEISGQLGIGSWDLLSKSDAALNADLADYRALGADWLRLDIRWDYAQSSASSGYVWTNVDRVVAAAEKYGIKVIGILNDTPNWTDASMASAGARSAYAKFAAAAASHLGDKVDHWEIYNEPNMKGITPANYTAMLKGAYAAIKAVDSGDVVITGGLAASPQTANGIYGAVDYLKGIYANGGEGYFDAVGYHPYTYPFMPTASDSWNGWQIMEDGIRGTMVANGDGDLQVWMTEFGAPTAGGATAVSQATQAAMITQATSLAANYSWAGPLLWHTYRDQGGSTNTVENWFGLVGPNGERKAAYYTFQSIATTQEGQSSGGGSGGGTGTGTSSGGVTVSGTTYTGNDAANTIVGSAASDTIYGNGGNDLITGGAGSDTIWGGAGNDRFIFANSHSIGSDLIKDFATGDKIDLSGIDANVNAPGDQAFTFIGSAWLSKAGDLGAYADPHGWTSITGDVNGDGAVDFCIRVEGYRAFTAGDFIL